jgi:hypothetical protein
MPEKAEKPAVEKAILYQKKPKSVVESGLVSRTTIGRHGSTPISARGKSTDSLTRAKQTLKKRVGTEPAQILSASEERRCIRAPMVGETAIHLQAPCFAGSEPHNEESSGASVSFLTGSPKDLG